jgi:hypothetical protein
MRLIGLMSGLLLLSAAPARAAEELSRKPGLWEVKTSIDTTSAPARVVQQCIDAATDRLLQSVAGPFNPAACSQREVQHAGEVTTIDFTCTVAGKAATAHSVVTGRLDSAYTMTVTAEGAVLPKGKMVMTMDGKWLGACAAGQKPGDVVLGNGQTINMPEIEQRSRSAAPQ